MTEAFVGFLALMASGTIGYLIARRIEGSKRWRDGYLYGFNHAWDEKAKLDAEVRDRHLKQLRKQRPRFQLIRGEKQ